MIRLWCRRCAWLGRSLKLGVAFALVCGGLPLASVQAETKIVPSMNVTGRYDSNIWGRPSQLLPAGTQQGDFVASTGGDVRLLHETRDLEANIAVGGSFNAYADNSNLNYFNAHVRGYVTLDRWVDQFVRGARLQIVENFSYTPETPGFISGVRETVVSSDGFFRGIQGFRANTFINTTSVTGSYPVSRDLSLEGGYTFGLRRVGRIVGGDTPGVSFFDTNTHTWFGGPRYQLTRNDSIAAVYRQTFMLQSRAEGGRLFSTTLVTLAGDYTKVFQEWKLSIEGGVTFVEPAGRTFPSGSIHITTQPERDTVLRAVISREARPSYFLQGGATISHLGLVGISHRLHERLTADGSAAYGYNQLFPNTNQTFQNFTALAKLSYKITRSIIGDLSYTYTTIKSDQSTLDYMYSRHQVGFFLRAEWN
ncbi:MAG: outer membrane beta-barrel protein [Nitrospira sp.]